MIDISITHFGYFLHFQSCLFYIGKEDEDESSSSSSSSDSSSSSSDGDSVSLQAKSKSSKDKKSNKEHDLAGDIELASLSSEQRRKRRKRKAYKNDLDSGVLCESSKAKRHHRRFENAKENTMVSTRTGKATSFKGGTVKKAPRKAAVGERSLTKEEARHQIASLGKKISDLLKERKKDKKDHLRALEIEGAHYERDKANWKLAEEQYVIILKNKMEEIAALKEMLRGGPRKKIKQGMNHAHCLEIIQTVRGPLYRVSKFLTTRQQILDACELIMSESEDGKKLLTGPDGNPLTGVIRSVAISDFASIYGDFVAKHLNKCRTNSQSQVKAALKALVTAGQAPTVQEYLQVIFRQGMDYDKKDPTKGARARTIFKWHWTEVVPKCAGNGIWKKSMRLEGTLSQHHEPGNVAKKYVTAET